MPADLRVCFLKILANGGSQQEWSRKQTQRWDSAAGSQATGEVWPAPHVSNSVPVKAPTGTKWDQLKETYWQANVSGASEADGK